MIAILRGICFGAAAFLALAILSPRPAREELDIKLQNWMTFAVGVLIALATAIH